MTYISRTLLLFILIFLSNLLKATNLRAYKVEKLNTHGGSLRLYVCKNSAPIKNNLSVQQIMEEEIKFGLKKKILIENFKKRL